MQPNQSAHRAVSSDNAVDPELEMFQFVPVNGFSNGVENTVDRGFSERLEPRRVLFPEPCQRVKAKTAFVHDGVLCLSRYSNTP